MMLIDYICQEEKGEKDLPAFMIVFMHRYNVSKSAQKGVEKDWLLPPETTQTTRASTQYMLQ